jgi:hypothetical protein
MRPGDNACKEDYRTSCQPWEAGAKSGLASFPALLLSDSLQEQACIHVLILTRINYKVQFSTYKPVWISLELISERFFFLTSQFV